DFCQIQYNYIDTQIQAGDKGYALAEKLGIPLIIMEPIKGGNLANLPDDIAQYFKSYDSNKSLSSWALRWVASHSNVKVILSGMSNMEHVMDNLDTFNHFSVLNDEEMECVRKVTEVILDRTKNGCTGCEYCMPCPHGVNIPRNFKIWNDLAIYGNKNQAVRRYWKDMPASERADMCQECGACEVLCPQSIQIINDLRRVNIEIPKE
ncbi:MAG: aldo/keto reductase, partial [Ignavibacteria bacterium]|nr:aldo/keto reductase [Ignavibacteria bacterium]